MRRSIALQRRTVVDQHFRTSMGAFQRIQQLLTH
jgi:hypothetical protein